ncbi:hypothetical protein QAD02_013318 [Eretmocerus hayati]|uniref:Uncharacterized protein n=1 Tax=Eretmocerus hayati TaxID=131215 RepID=A0ACC2P3Y3_9HYME|nr:hypothetical protein QAD02_013318 [Eretmocerus hayati]
MILQAGCPNWQPLNELTEEEVETARTYLMGYKHFNLDDIQIARTVNEVFVRSFRAQRQYSNNLSSPPTVRDIIQEWPCILKSVYLCQHYFLLTNVLSDTISQNFINRRIEIFIYAHQNSVIELDAVKSSDDRDYLALSLVLKKFKEPMDRVFHPLALNISIQEEWPFNYPSVRVTKDVITNAGSEEEPQNKKKTKYSLIIDKKKILSTFYLEEILAGLLCSYFVLNRTYPAACSATFEFLQMYFANVFSSQECRSKLAKQKLKASTFNNALKKMNVGTYLSKEEIATLNSDLMNR